MKEQEHFNQIGKFASNKYYINQDKKDKEQQLLKGGSRQVAEDLRAKDEKAHNMKKELMVQAAAKRKEEMAEYEDLMLKKKEEIRKKKADLRKVQDADHMAKLNYNA